MTIFYGLNSCLRTTEYKTEGRNHDIVKNLH